MIPIAEDEFAFLPHRRVPRIYRGSWNTRFYRVPLTHGHGTGIRIRAAGPGQESPMPLVLVLHGLGDDSTFPLWPWFDEFVRAGFEVFSLDWDGHGVAGDSLLDFRSIGKSLRSVLTGIREQWHPASIDVVGHSTGSLVATVYRELEIAEKVPSRVRRYFLVSSAVALRTEKEWPGELRSFLNPEFWLECAPAAVRVFGFPGALPAVGRFKRREFPVRVADPAQGSAVVQLQKALLEYRPATLPPSSERPACHAYYGERDSIVHEGSGLMILKTVFGEVRLTRFPNRGHLLTAISPETARIVARDLRSS